MSITTQRTTFNTDATAWLGIDPGLSGAFATIFADGRVNTMPMPTLKRKQKNGNTKLILDRKAILHFLHQLPSFTFCCIEQQIPVRNQNINASHTTSMNYGILLMGLSCAHVGHREIPSNKWQAHFGIVQQKKGVAGETTKVQALRIVKDIYSDVDLKESPRTKKPHEGVVDAILLAEYGKEMRFRMEGSKK